MVLLVSQRLSQYNILESKDNLIDNAAKQAINELCINIPNCIELYVSGKTLCAYKLLSDIIDKNMHFLKELNNIWIKCIDDVQEPANRHYDFYRSRDITTTNVDELKHIPFDKLYITSSQRFTNSGCADLYLSYTKKACESEIGNDGTIARFELKKTSKIKVFDMCAFEFNSYNNYDQKDDKQLKILWPLIAACNSIAYCCVDSKHECKELKRSFKIEYVIPQMFAAYLKSRNIANGIRYYTVRDENLNPAKIDMMDVVLFTNYSPNNCYDDQLLDKFDISIITNR